MTIEEAIKRYNEACANYAALMTREWFTFAIVIIATAALLYDLTRLESETHECHHRTYHRSRNPWMAAVENFLGGSIIHAFKSISNGSTQNRKH